MRNKKGDLMNNVLGVIIAVIGLSLLAYGAYKVYQNVVNSEEQKAKAIIDSIEGKMNALNDGQIGKFAIQGIKDWYITGWSKTETGRPDKCALESCICICPQSTEFGSGDFDWSKEKTTCQDKGFCRKTENHVAVISSGDVAIVADIFGLELKEIELSKYKDVRPKIILPSNLVEISIEKKKDDVIIFSQIQEQKVG